MKALGTSILVSIVLLVTAWSGLGSTAVAAETARGAGTGNLSVATVNAAGKPVAGALVNVFASGGGAVASGTTNANGKIVFSGLAAGSYGIFASKTMVVSGFPIAIYGSANATVKANKTTGVIVALVNSAP